MASRFVRIRLAGAGPWFARGTALCLVLCLCGCFAYVPAPPDGLAQGTRVRAQLSQPGDFRLTEITANQVVLVRGEMIRTRGDTLLLSATWLQSQSGFDFPAGGVTLRIPRETVARLERRRLSTTRTALLAGGVTLLALVAGFSFDAQGGGGSNGGGPTPQ